MKRYSIVYADPPWDYGERPLWCRGGANQHYQTQSVDWIASLPIGHLAAWHSACFLWATFPRLAEALYILRRWGFEYRTVAFTWVKVNRGSDSPFFGMGQWTRANAEICLLGTRGIIRRRDKSIPQVILAPPAEHSRKPDEARERIVRLLGDLPRIELFARPETPLFPRPEGWDVWGNEMDSDIDMQSLQAELDAIDAGPLPPERIDEMVRGALNARWCDGCGDRRPFDPEHPERWSTDDADGCLWHYCFACTRRRIGESHERAS